MLKIALTSDTHYGHCTKQQLVNMFGMMARQAPDLIIHAGDWTGTHGFPESVEQTMDALRQAIQDTPVLAVRGNHDLWMLRRSKRTAREWRREEEAGRTAGNLAGVIWLDEYSGGYIHEGTNTHVVGTMTWYAAVDPVTNDAAWMPATRDREPSSRHATIRNAERGIWERICTGLGEDKPERLLVVTHHPLVYPAARLGEQAHGGPPSWADELEKALGHQPLAYINGHYHQLWEGQRDTAGRVRFECGSDYGSPCFITFTL